MRVCGLAIFVDMASMNCARVIRAETQCSLHVSFEPESVPVCCNGMNNESTDSAFDQENRVCQNDPC